MTDKKQDLRAEVMVLVDIYARALTDRIAELEAQLEAVGAGGVSRLMPAALELVAWFEAEERARGLSLQELFSGPASHLYSTKWHWTHIKPPSNNPLYPLYAAPQPPQIAAPAMPVPWVPGPNEFKDWCSRWFGPDADDSYLAKAAFDLPPTAQQFERPAAAPQPQQIAEPANPPPHADFWYLQDTRSFIGNDVVWWAKDGKGYTTDVSEAHVYDRASAFRQADARGVDRPWPKAYIDSKTRPVVDFQYLDRADATKEQS